MVAAVYRYGDVTRTEAIFVCDHYDFQTRGCLRGREEKKLARGQVISVVGIKLYKLRSNDPGRDSIII